MRTQRYILILGTVALAVLLSGCVSGGGATQADAAQNAVATKSVRVQDNNFDPEAIAVAPGDTVRWQWQGDSDHNVVGDDFQSRTQSSGSFAHRFESPGTYEYQCTLHGGMQGTVVVTEQAAAVGTTVTAEEQ